MAELNSELVKCEAVFGCDNVTHPARAGPADTPEIAEVGEGEGPLDRMWSACM